MRLKDIPPEGISLEKFLEDRPSKRARTSTPKTSEQPKHDPNPRMALLDKMKAIVPNNPEARADFREVVTKVLEVWDGQTPLFFFAWLDGCHLMVLRGEKARRAEVFAHQRELEAFLDAAAYGEVHLTEEGKALTQLTPRAARDWLRAYYVEKEPLASTYRTDLYS